MHFQRSEICKIVYQLVRRVRYDLSWRLCASDMTERTDHPEKLDCMLCKLSCRVYALDIQLFCALK